jgi:Na+/H+ antiporter NhaD/arsenite permease-like protein
VLTVHLIVAGAAVGALALGPRSPQSGIAVAGAAAIDVALGAQVLPALAVAMPLVAFLSAALTLAAQAERAGLAERAAGALATHARGSTLALFVLVCGLCALLTAAVSLDGAVVLMLPVVRALARRYGAPFAPLFFGVVAVANTASIAVPQGNPTNLIVIDRLAISPAQFLGHMLVPGLAAAALCAIAVGACERRALASTYSPRAQRRRPLRGAAGRACGLHLRGGVSTSDVLSGSFRAAPPAPPSAERHAALSLAAAAFAAWLSPLLGVAPWWPFAGVAAAALALRRERPCLIVPWRLAAQVTGLLVVTQALALPASAPGAPGLLALAAVALGVGAASAIANNLPVSVGAAALLSAGPSAYAASIGLGVGSLASAQGSAATLIAADLAGEAAPPFPLLRFAPLAAAAVLAATLCLWAGVS